MTHTDLKPENILFLESDYEVVTDSYKFPEQVNSKKEIFGSDYASDISEVVT